MRCDGVRWVEKKVVIPAKAGISWSPAETSRPEVPASAGMTC
jgi:hypothetical protein